MDRCQELNMKVPIDFQVAVNQYDIQTNLLERKLTDEEAKFMKEAKISPTDLAKWEKDDKASLNLHPQQQPEKKARDQ